MNNTATGRAGSNSPVATASANTRSGSRRSPATTVARSFPRNNARLCVTATGS